MTRLSHPARTLLLAGACLVTALAVPRRAAAQQLDSPTVASISAQLGVKAMPRNSDVLGVGETITAILEHPDRLAAFGIRDMHVGARVTIVRISRDRVRIEADELEPKMVNAAATVKLESDGKLVAAST